MDEKAIINLINKLSGIRWFAIAGFSMFIYTNGKRKFDDIDIVVHEDDSKLFSKKFEELKKRVIDKGSFIVDDVGAEFYFEGLKIEATTGYPKKRVEEKTFNKLFNHINKRNYLGKEIFLAPIEEIIIQKAFMHRNKDISDLKLLIKEKINLSLLKEIAIDFGKYKEIIKILEDTGFLLNRKI